MAARGVLVLLAVFAFAVVPFGVLFLFTDRIPEPLPRDHLTALGAVQAGGSFAVQVTFANGSSLWLGSTDGGATWTKVTSVGPLAPSSGSHGRSAVQCADDDVCYVMHENKRGSFQLVDRLDPDHTWRNDTSLDKECSGTSLAVDPGNSARAIVDCSNDATITYRTLKGKWRVLNLAEVARALR